MFSDFLGEGGSSMTAYMQLTGAMLGNIGVYLFGVLWSARNHDPVPGYMELRIEKEALEAQYDRLYTEMVGSRAQGHREKAQKDSSAKRAADRNQQTSSNYPANRQLFQRLQKKDQEVLSLLGTYRSQLVSTAKRSGKAPGVPVRGLLSERWPREESPDTGRVTWQPTCA